MATVSPSRANTVVSKCWTLKAVPARRWRSEEHTSELQSRQYLVCRLLLEKKTQARLRFAQAGDASSDCLQMPKAGQDDALNEGRIDLPSVILEHLLDRPKAAEIDAPRHAQ